MAVVGHMILSSCDSTEFFPHNTPNDFTTWLRYPLYRKSGVDYEIALTELHVVTTVQEFSPNVLTYQKPKTGTVMPELIVVNITRKDLESTSDLVEALQHGIETQSPSSHQTDHPVSFTYDKMTFKTKVTLSEGHSVTLSYELAKMLGFGEVHLTETTTSERNSDLYAGSRIFYIFCDQVEDNMFGSTNGPLLGFVSIPNGTLDVSEVVTKEFQNPMYVKLVDSRLDRLRIYIKTENEDSAQFGVGCTVVRLTLRERS